MKRFALVFVTMCGFLLSVAPAHAAMRQMAVAGSPVGLPVTALRVPDKAFVPAQIDPIFDRVYDNSQAERSDFRDNHATSYTALGRVTGYFERATWGAVTFSYQGSVFGSPYEASNALREGLAATGAHVNTAPEGCTYIYHHSCSMLSFTYSNKGSSSSASSAPANPSPTKDGSSNGSSTTPALTGDGGVYAVLQYNQCLVEVKAQAPAQIFDDSKDTIVPTAWAILTEGNNAVSRSCGSGGVAVAPNLDFHIIVTRVEPKHASSSIDAPGLRSTQAGKPVNLVVYFAVTRNVRPDTALAHFTVAHGSSIQFKGGSLPVNLPAGPGVYRIAVHYTPHATGKVSVLGRVTVGRQSQQMSTAIKVVR